MKLNHKYPKNTKIDLGLAWYIYHHFCFFSFRLFVCLFVVKLLLIYILLPLPLPLFGNSLFNISVATGAAADDATTFTAYNKVKVTATIVTFTVTVTVTLPGGSKRILLSKLLSGCCCFCCCCCCCCCRYGGCGCCFLASAFNTSSCSSHSSCPTLGATSSSCFCSSCRNTSRTGTRTRTRSLFGAIESGRRQLLGHYHARPALFQGCGDGQLLGSTAAIAPSDYGARRRARLQMMAAAAAAVAAATAPMAARCLHLKDRRRRNGGTAAARRDQTASIFGRLGRNDNLLIAAAALQL